MKESLPGRKVLKNLTMAALATLAMTSVGAQKTSTHEKNIEQKVFIDPKEYEKANKGKYNDSLRAYKVGVFLNKSLLEGRQKIKTVKDISELKKLYNVHDLLGQGTTHLNVPYELYGSFYNSSENPQIFYFHADTKLKPESISVYTSNGKEKQAVANYKKPIGLPGYKKPEIKKDTLIQKPPEQRALDSIGKSPLPEVEKTKYQPEQEKTNWFFIYRNGKGNTENIYFKSKAEYDRALKEALEGSKIGPYYLGSKEEGGVFSALFTAKPVS